MPFFLYAHHFASIITEGDPRNIPSTSSHNQNRPESSNPWKRGSTKLNSTRLNQNPVQLRIHQAPRRPSQRGSSKKRQQQQCNPESSESYGQSFCSLRMISLLDIAYFAYLCQGKARTSTDVGSESTNAVVYFAANTKDW